MGGRNMAAVSPFLFSWNDVEARSDLERFYLVRDNLPDENIVVALEKRRGNGRDDFPIRAMWNALYMKHPVKKAHNYPLRY